MATMQRACNEPRCSALSNVSLVVGITAGERIPWLLDYSLWFANLRFMVPRSECADCHCRVRRLPRLHRHNTACDCDAGFNTSLDHPAATRGMQRAAAAAKELLGWPVLGVLFTHMDMWVNVRSFQSVNFDAIWSPRLGLLTNPHAPSCHARGPSWRRHVPGYIGAQTQQCHSAQVPLLPLVSRHVPGEILRTGDGPTQPLQSCCFGWADMYYVPIFALDVFAELSSALGTEFLEVAIPTIANLIEKQGNVTWWKIGCLGDCCHQLNSPSKNDPTNGRAFCGHKLALDKPQYRGLLTRTVHPNITQARVLIKGDFERFNEELKITNQTYRKNYSGERVASRIRHCGSQLEAEDPWSPAWVEKNAP